MPANPALLALTAQHFKRNNFQLEIKKKEEIRKEKNNCIKNYQNVKNFWIKSRLPLLKFSFYLQERVHTFEENMLTLNYKMSENSRFSYITRCEKSNKIFFAKHKMAEDS